MSGIVVQPIRFTDDVAAMRDFLTVLGLRARLESDRGGWVDLASGGGRAALHSAATSATGAIHGETHLSFETDDVDAWLIGSRRPASRGSLCTTRRTVGRWIAAIPSVAPSP